MYNDHLGSRYVLFSKIRLKFLFYFLISNYKYHVQNILLKVVIVFFNQTYVFSQRKKLNKLKFVQCE